MLEEVPADLPRDIREEVAAIIKVLREVGWDVGPIIREARDKNMGSKGVSFVAKSTNGRTVNCTCSQTSLPARLTALL